MRQLRLKTIALFMAFLLINQAVLPTVSYALTSGPGQPEISHFQPVGTSNMVDLSSGNFSYNIPLFEIGGYPINMAYQGGITMEQEASWVGLGWTLNPGSVTRNLRGLPDDFKGDMVEETTNIKTKVVKSVTGDVSFELFGVGEDAEGKKERDTDKKRGTASIGFTVSHDNYYGRGFELTPDYSKAKISSNLLKVSQDEKSEIEDGDEEKNKELDEKFKLDEVFLDIGPSFSSSGPAKLNPSLGFNTVKKTSTVANQDPNVWSGGLRLSLARNRTGVYGMNVGLGTQAHVSRPRPTPKGSEFINFGLPVSIPQITRRTVTTGSSENIGLGVEVTWANILGDVTFTKTVTGYPEKKLERPAYGYFYLDQGYVEEAEGEQGHSWLMDMGKENVAPYTTDAQYLPIPYLSHDIFSMTGQGINNTFRARRNDVGFIAEPTSNSNGDNKSIAVDAGFPIGGIVKVGGDLGGVYNFSETGKWLPIGNLVDLSDAVTGPERGISVIENTEFKNSNVGLSVNPNYEGFFFKSSSETEGTDATFRTRWGNSEPVRLDLKNPIVVPLASATITSDLEFEDEKGIEYHDTDPNNKTLASEHKIISGKQPRANHISYRLAGEYHDDEHPYWIDIRSSEKGKYSWAPNNTGYSYIKRNGEHRKKHHLSQVSATNASGMRYVYGIPVYNLEFEQTSFNVVPESGKDNSNYDCEAGTVIYDETEDNTISNKNGINRFYSSKKIDPYPTSFLLTQVESPDYVDILGNGLTDDDLGSAVRFNYTKLIDEYKWRIPYSANSEEPVATHMPALLSDEYDDQASYTYGSKEIWYTHSIESKQEIAVFHISDRDDARGVDGRNGGRNDDNKLQKLDKIELFVKEDFIKNKELAVPYKTVHFDYEYALCKGVHNHKDYNATTDYSTANAPNHGKLTLKSVHFTYGKSKRGETNKYKFYYADVNHTGDNEHVVDHNYNPHYQPNAHDRWGGYQNPGDCSTNEYAHEDYYATQDETIANQEANMWQLHTIQLPSGGRLKIDYESDDYAFVQDKKAMQMLQMERMWTSDENGQKDQQAHTSGLLYDKNEIYDVVSFILPETLPTNTDPDEALQWAIDNYLTDENSNTIDHLRYRALVELNNQKKEYIDGYLSLYRNEDDEDPDFGKYEGVGISKSTGPTGPYDRLAIRVNYPKASLNKQGDAISFQDKKDAGRISFHPISWAAWDYMMDNTPRLVTNTKNKGVDVEYDMEVEGKEAWQQLVASMSGALDFLRTFQRVMKTNNMANKLVASSSWVRFYNPNGFKKGGGHRVKRVSLDTDWYAMSGSTPVAGTESYITQYDYTEAIEVNDETTYRSSGVATYEPMIGNEENPWTQLEPMGTKRKHLPGLSHFYEGPRCQTFFPSAEVTYARVKESNVIPDDVSAPNNGLTMHQFYTSREFPIKVKSTSIEKNRFAPQVSVPFFFSAGLRAYTLSQGYSVELNNMNGRSRATWYLTEGDEEKADPNTEYLSGTKTVYKIDPTDPTKILSNLDVMQANGETITKELGVDMDVYTDTHSSRNFTAQGNAEGNVDISPIPAPPGFLPAPTFWANGHLKEEVFRTTVTTKVITKKGFVDKVITKADGSETTAENVLFDALTGSPLVTKTTNEFGTEIFSTSLLARWAYNDMDASYKNYRTELIGIDFDPNNNYSIVETAGSNFQTANVGNFIRHGDEVGLRDIVAEVKEPIFRRLWVFENNNDFHLIDEYGDIYDISPSANSALNLLVLKPARRNYVTASVGNIVSANAPYFQPNGQPNNEANVISASATEYKDEWNLYCCGILDLSWNLITDDIDERTVHAFSKLSKQLSNEKNKNTNPFIRNLQGNYREHKSHVFQGNRNRNFSVANGNKQDVLISESGYLQNFKYFYEFYGSGLQKHTNPTTSPSQEWELAEEVTIIDPYGNALEARNALDIYSANVAGYDNQLITASANNSKHRNFGFDGFEDYTYKRGYSFKTIYPMHFGFNHSLSAPHLSIDENESHTGLSSLQIQISAPSNLATHNSRFKIMPFGDEDETTEIGQIITSDDCIPQFSPETGEYYLSAWVKEEKIPNDFNYARTYVSIQQLNCDQNPCIVNSEPLEVIFRPEGPIIDGWQRIFGKFEVTNNHCPDCSSNCSETKYLKVTMAVEDHNFDNYDGGAYINSDYKAWFDDIRVFPVDATMTSYVYNPYTLKLEATLDENNYAVLYDYALDGSLERTKRETERGIMTIQENKQHVKQ